MFFYSVKLKFSSCSLFLQIFTEQEYPKFVKIVEVGPRDGLQNEKVLAVISLTNLCYIDTSVYYYAKSAGKSRIILHI